MKIRWRDRTGTRDYRYIKEDVDRHGNVRLYFRRGREPKVRLIEKPGTPAFEAEYLRAYAGEIATFAPPDTVTATAIRRPGPAASETLRWLVEQYYESAVFKKLDDSTRRVRRRILDAICERTLGGGDPRRLGSLPFAGMEPQHVATLRDEKVDTPEAANSYVKAMRAVFKWACHPEYKLAARNPAKDVGYLESDNPDGHRTWTEDEVTQFEAHYPLGTKARLALDLFLYTGVRISDVVRLGPQMERPHPEWGTMLVFTEFKGRKRTPKKHELPILPPLRASLDAYQAAQAAANKGKGRQLVYLPTAFGQPHTAKGFGNWFVDCARRARLDKGLSAHGLRKFGAVRCVDAGATVHDLMALFGWTTTKQAELYTRKANRARGESRAAPLLQRGVTGAQPENKKAAISGKSGPLSGGVPSGGPIGAKKP